MNKMQLKEKWGKYTNTDKLVGDISSLLTTWGHRNTERGICKMLDTYFTRKEPLINLLAKSKNYLGDMRIMLPTEIERKIPTYDVQRFVDGFRYNKNIKGSILQTKDDSGKTMLDYLKTGTKHFDVTKIEEIKKDLSFMDAFNHNGHTHASSEKYKNFVNVITRFYYIHESNLSQKNVDEIASKGYNGKLSKGLKTSRAFNKVCCDFGVDKASEYNKLFAIYSDMVSPGTQKLNYVISVNPYDYLTMSFGRSWTSCQSIKNGGWKGGTLSYMLDKSSIITYMIEPTGNPQTSDKIYRNMIHYKDYTFIQGRIYPQDNDGATNLYNVFRNIICEEMTKLLELKGNEWDVQSGTTACGRHTVSHGVHYKDYQHFSSCNVFYPIEKQHHQAVVEIGSAGICPYCGEEYSCGNLLSHGSCH